MQLLYRINRTGTTVLVVTHDREMVDKMRRRVIALEEGRLVRDEAAGGYHDESTTEFAARIRAEMGVGDEGGTNGHSDDRPGTSRWAASSSSSPRPSGRCAAAPRRASPRSSRSSSRRCCSACWSRSCARASRRRARSATRSAFRSSSTATRPGPRSTALQEKLARAPARHRRRVLLARVREEGARRRALRRPRGLDRRAQLQSRCRPPSRSRSTIPTTSRRCGPRCCRRTRPASRRRSASAIDPPIGQDRENATKIREVTGAVQIVLIVIAALLLVASLLLVANTIRLSIYARRREVEVMRLVGATNWFIRWPFMIEGVIVGLVGAGIAVGILWALQGPDRGSARRRLQPRRQLLHHGASCRWWRCSSPRPWSSPRSAAASPCAASCGCEQPGGRSGFSSGVVIGLVGGLVLATLIGVLVELAARRAAPTTRSPRRSETIEDNYFEAGRPGAARRGLDPGHGRRAPQALRRPLLPLLHRGAAARVRGGHLGAVLRRRPHGHRGAARAARRQRLPGHARPRRPGSRRAT